MLKQLKLNLYLHSKPSLRHPRFFNSNTSNIFYKEADMSSYTNIFFLFFDTRIFLFSETSIIVPLVLHLIRGHASPKLRA